MATTLQLSTCCSDQICTCDDCECPSVLDATLEDDMAVSLAAGFAALSDPVRLKLVSLLAGADRGAGCVCNFIDPLGKSQSTVSHHLKVLLDAGLVTSQRAGRLISYELVDERLGVLQTALTREHRHG